MAGENTRGAHRPIVVTHEGGVRFAADVRGHVVMTDQPAQGGGQDSAPMPLEMMGVALASCVALYVQKFCEVRGIAHAGMRVELDTFGARDPNRVGAYELRVVLPEAVPERYRDAIDRVARSCAVHNTLTHPPQVSVDVTAEEAVGV
ncbi:MAG: OsmC family protein [Gemmatimonadota bacterium]